MRRFFLTFCSGLALVAGVNFWVDPVNRWRWTGEEFLRTWSETQCWRAPGNFNERKARRLQILAIKKPDVLFLGSSRVMLAGQQLLEPGLRAYNAGVSDAVI